MTLRRSVCVWLAVLTSSFLPQSVRAERPLVSLVPVGTRPNGEPFPDPVRKEQPPGVSLPEILILDDATKIRGQAATGQMPDALVFWQPHDSGFGWYMKSDDVFGYGTWANQMFLSNGFAPGDEVSSYDLLVHNASAPDSGNDASFKTELWTGDPFSMMETICAAEGVSAPIPGTQAFFTDVPPDSLVRLRAELPEKVTLDCSRVWMVTTMLEGCSAAWRIAGVDGVPWNARASVGASDGVWLQYACEQFGACETPNGYNAGTCCGTNAPCDHTDGEFECGAGDPTFCGDGAADYFVAAIDEPDVVRSLVGTVWSPSTVTVWLVPVGTGPDGELADNAVIEGNEITLSMDGEQSIPVFLEFRIGDWDPDDTDVQLAAWQIKLDAASLASGKQGELTAYTAGGAGTCASDADCVALLGPGGACDPPGYYKTNQFGAGYCSYLLIDQDRADWVYHSDFGTQGPIVVTDVSTVNIRPAATILFRGPDDPEPYPEGGLYAGTIAILVPPDARGTFTINIRQFPETQLVNQDSQFIPRQAVAPAKINIDIGRCCFNLQDVPIGGGECTTDLSAAECALPSGTTWHDPDKTCDDPCPEVCGDNLLNRPEEVCDGTDDDACPGSCLDDCRCAFCGDHSTNQESEECDGFDDEACPGICRFDCTCTRDCGDGIQVGNEECDGLDDESCPGLCLNDCTCAAFCGDDVVNQPSEECDGADDGACPGVCLPDCICAVCGDEAVNQPSEECDGADDSACPAECLSNCRCPVCGDDSVNQVWEECDGSDDIACPTFCLEDCSCGTFCGDNEINQPGEECDGTDDGACPGICRFDCTCTRECGDNIQVGDEECDGEDDSACLGECLANCLCPGCGDDSVNQVWEECDGSDDTACPTFCLEDCSCGTFCGDDAVNQPGEECDGSDDEACPGVCLADCVCPVCGDNEVNQPGEECDGLSDFACPEFCRDDCTCTPCIFPPVLSSLVDANFACDDSLPRVGRAILRFEFDAPIFVPPNPGGVEIRELLPGGGFSETDLSELFEFTVEDDVLLVVREDGCINGTCDFDSVNPTCVDGPDKGLPCGRVLENETWYAFMNAGNWCTTTDFQLHYAVVYGDANNDHVTSFGDLSAINSMLSGLGDTPDDSRFDINTIGGVSFADLSAAIAFINSSTLNAKPSGHVCTPIP